MRIVFCGSGACGVPSLGAILDAGHDIVLAVTQPPRKAGRSRKLRATPLADAAQARGVAVFACPDVNAADAVARIRSAQPEVICVVDFGQKVGPAVRAAAPLGAFNLHGSLLPELRGAAPANWAIIRGYRRTGMTTFSLVDRMDAGPIYLQSEMEISPDETAGDLRERFATAGAGLMCRTLELLASGRAEPAPQDDSRATLAPMLKKSDGLIDFSQAAEIVRNRIHGVWPWPGAQALLLRDGAPELPVLLARAALAEGPPRAAPGVLDDELAVSTGDGRLSILEIQPAGKRLMSWQGFVNGYRPAANDRFALEAR